MFNKMNNLNETVILFAFMYKEEEKREETKKNRSTILTRKGSKKDIFYVLLYFLLSKFALLWSKSIVCRTFSNSFRKNRMQQIQTRITVKYYYREFENYITCNQIAQCALTTTEKYGEEYSFFIICHFLHK